VKKGWQIGNPKIGESVADGGIITEVDIDNEKVEICPFISARIRDLQEYKRWYKVDYIWTEEGIDWLDSETKHSELVGAEAGWPVTDKALQKAGISGDHMKLKELADAGFIHKARTDGFKYGARVAAKMVFAEDEANAEDEGASCHLLDCSSDSASLQKTQHDLHKRSDFIITKAKSRFGFSVCDHVLLTDHRRGCSGCVVGFTHENVKVALPNGVRNVCPEHLVQVFEPPVGHGLVSHAEGNAIAASPYKFENDSIQCLFWVHSFLHFRRCAEVFT
jgi:hypothetical protein